jgi:hypothetical protein
MGNEITLESVEDLQERWSYLKIQNGQERLLITECFKTYGKHTYIIEGLEMELEEDCVMCDDYYGEIIKRDSPIMAFLKQHLLSIKLIPIGNGYRERLEFDGDGIVYIEKHVN